MAQMVGVEPTRQSPVLKHFECSLLRPLEYICIFNFVAGDFPQGAISSAPSYDHLSTSAYLILLQGTSRRARFRVLPLTTSWVMLHSINFVQLIITACGANVNSLRVGKCRVGKCQWGVSAMNVCVFCMTSCRVARSCKTSPVSRE